MNDNKPPNVLAGPGLIRPGEPVHHEDLQEFRPERADRATFMAIPVSWAAISSMREIQLASALMAIAERMPGFEDRPTSVAMQMIPNPDPNDAGIVCQLQCQVFSGFREDILAKHLEDAVKKEFG